MLTRVQRRRRILQIDPGRRRPSHEFRAPAAGVAWRQQPPAAIDFSLRSVRYRIFHELDRDQHRNQSLRTIGLQTAWMSAPSPDYISEINLIAVMLGRKQYAAAFVVIKVENPVTLIGDAPLGCGITKILSLGSRVPIIGSLDLGGSLTAPTNSLS